MRKWSIGKKLVSGVAAILICTATLGVVSYWALGQADDDLANISEKVLHKAEISGSIYALTMNARAEARAVVISAALKRPQDLEQARVNGEKAFDQIDAYVQEIRPMLVDARAKGINEK